MKRLLLAALVVVGARSAGASPGAAAAPAPAAFAPTTFAPAPAEAAKKPSEAQLQLRVPLFSEAFAGTPVARVDGEVITVHDLTQALADMHSSSRGSAKSGKTDFMPALDRLVDLRLILAEARDMGLAELPAVKQELADYEESAPRDLLRRRATRDVQADPAEVEKLYREQVRELKLASALFETEEAAKQFAADVSGGKPFGATAKALAADKKAKAAEDGRFLPASKMLPGVLQAVDKMQVGQVSAPVAVPQGFAVFQLEELRFPENAEARAAAEAAALDRARSAKIRAYYEELVKKHARVDKAAIRRLDLGTAKKFEAALKDRRPLATIAGAKPVTVADLAAELRSKFFHGVDRAAERKKVDRRKDDAFEAILRRRAADREAELLKLRDGEEYRRGLEETRSALLFGAFAQKAIAPEVKVTEEDVKKYYEQHQAEFMFPAFYKLESMAFARSADAQAALDKIRKGTDFRWLRANTDGQLPDAQRTMSFEGNLVSTTQMPEDVRAAVSGTKTGDVRLLEAQQGEHHVLFVVEYHPPRARPFEDVQDGIEKRLFGDAMNQGVRDWSAKLRTTRKVEVFMTRPTE